MATFSAKNARVQSGASAFVHVAEWEFTAESNNPDYRSSGTAGWVGRVAGHSQVTGSFRMFIDDATPQWASPVVMVPGVSIADLRLYEDAATFHSGPAIVDSIVPRADIDGDGIVEMTVNFSSTGAWVLNQ